MPNAAEVRSRIILTTLEMLAASRQTAASFCSRTPAPILRQLDAEYLCADSIIQAAAPVDLVVTSPPYPGIHILYHRWQVDGRKESNAPYWIAACSDGRGASYYNFADRNDATQGAYFDKALRSFRSVRSVMKSGAVLAQLVAFSNRRKQLPRYLATMERAGFAEMRDHGARRVWRGIPSRRWHASSKGPTQSSREVVLLHVAE